MKIAVIGTGYVGLVAGTCFAEIGHRVVCVDNNEQKILDLREGKLPIYEPGLDDLVPKNVAEGRLHFTTDLGQSVEEAEIVFIAVGTPAGEDGSADLRHVIAVAEAIGEHLNGFKLVVVKSTVPIGTCDKVRAIIASRSREHFVIVSNPEFLREGVAVNDFLHPDRILVGTASPEASKKMRELYQPILDRGAPMVTMDVRSSELTKYASNAMLATRISFMNDLAGLCERVGADIELVRHGMGSDGRIGPAFLRAGVGYGGSCFPKDLQALRRTAFEYATKLEILEAVERVNIRQKTILVRMVKEEFGDDLKGKTLALWGLSFKPETDDMREAPSVEIVAGLHAAGAKIIAYDPQAARTATEAISHPFELAKGPYEAVRGADALLLVTEWKSFAVPDWRRVKGLMKGRRVFDGRNLWEPAKIRAEGFTYRGIGRR
jgi:UDPglucose 6-dehydrogenase